MPGNSTEREGCTGNAIRGNYTGDAIYKANILENVTVENENVSEDVTVKEDNKLNVETQGKFELPRKQSVMQATRKCSPRRGAKEILARKCTEDITRKQEASQEQNNLQKQETIARKQPGKNAIKKMHHQDQPGNISMLMYRMGAKERCVDCGEHPREKMPETHPPGEDARQDLQGKW